MTLVLIDKVVIKLMLLIDEVKLYASKNLDETNKLLTIRDKSRRAFN